MNVEMNVMTIPLIHHASDSELQTPYQFYFGSFVWMFSFHGNKNNRLKVLGTCGQHSEEKVPS